MSIGYRERKALNDDHYAEERRRWLAEQQRKDEASPPSVEDLFHDAMPSPGLWVSVIAAFGVAAFVTLVLMVLGVV